MQLHESLLTLENMTDRGLHHSMSHESHWLDMIGK